MRSSWIETMPTRAFHVLLTRRRQPGRMLLVAAALPLVFMGALGAEEGEFGWYAVLALICLLQAGYPTLLGWLLAVAIYFIFSAIYVFVTIRDLTQLALGRQASLFLNPTDDA